MRFVGELVLLASVSASGQMLEAKTYATTGHPTQALAAPGGEYVLVTSNQDKTAGLDVFRYRGGTLERVGFQPLDGKDAQAVVLIPHTRMLAIGLSNEGVAFVSLDDAIAGKAKTQKLAQGEKAGSGYLAVAPDGQFLFVANEYGDNGNIGVIALHPDGHGAIHPETLAQIPTPRTTPGVVISADGTRLYTEAEVVPADAAVPIPGHGLSELERQGCVQARPDRQNPNGMLYGIDVTKARALTKESSKEQIAATRVAIEDAGCSPVREDITRDGRTVYVTARGDNNVLVYDAKKLESDPEHAFLRAIPSGGEAPVGLKLFADDKALLVANSNRFAGGPGNAAVFDIADPAKPALKQTIPTGPFPRNITSSPDGKTLYLTIFNGNQLMVLTTNK